MAYEAYENPFDIYVFRNVDIDNVLFCVACFPVLSELLLWLSLPWVLQFILCGKRTLKSKMEVRKSSSTSWNLIVRFYCFVCVLKYSITTATQSRLKPTSIKIPRGMRFVCVCFSIDCSFSLSLCCAARPSPSVATLVLLFFIHAYAWATCGRVWVRACLYLRLFVFVCVSAMANVHLIEKSTITLEKLAWSHLPPHTTYHITSHLFSSLVLKAIVSTYKVPKASLGVTWIIMSFSCCACVSSIRFDDSHNLCVIFLTSTHTCREWERERTEFHFSVRWIANLSVYWWICFLRRFLFRFEWNEASTRYDRAHWNWTKRKKKHFLLLFLCVINGCLSWPNRANIDRFDGCIDAQNACTTSMKTTSNINISLTNISNGLLSVTHSTYIAQLFVVCASFF